MAQQVKLLSLVTFLLNSPVFQPISTFYLDSAVLGMLKPWRYRWVLKPKGCVHTKHDGVVTGFGDVDEKGTSPKNLQQVHVNVAEQAYCADLYKQMGDQIDDSMICAGKIRGKYDSCQKDSGGPLVCRHDPPKKANEKKKNFYLRTKFLHGVVSWGRGCGQPKQYGVYANVTYFVPWINQMINNA